MILNMDVPTGFGKNIVMPNNPDNPLNRIKE